MNSKIGMRYAAHADLLRTATARETCKKIMAVFLLVLAFAVLHRFGITCPIKLVTGVSCAGCGMTRAWIAILHLDPKTAFYYHPLFWIVPVAAVLYVLRRRIGRNVWKACMIGMAAAMLAVYVFRMFCGDGDIVVFEPGNSLFFKIVSLLGGCV